MEESWAKCSPISDSMTIFTMSRHPLDCASSQENALPWSQAGPRITWHPTFSPSPGWAAPSSEPSGHLAQVPSLLLLCPHPRPAARQVTSLPETLRISGSPQNKIQASNHKAHLMVALLPSSLPTSLCSVPQTWQAPSLIFCFYFWLPWVFVAVQGFSSWGKWGLLSRCGAWASHCNGFSRFGARALGRAGSGVVALGLSCPSIFTEQRLNLCPLHWKVDF